MQFRMGCAVWAFKGWVGEFYPAGSRASDFLRLYGDRLLTVEGNTTFYSVPNEETVARWAAETPPDFRFCLKVPRDITHGGLLAPAMPKAIAFAERMAGLGERLGPFFAQLPPSYGPAQFEDLAAFVAAWPQGIAPLAVEVRHPQWFTPAGDRRLNELLQSHDVGRVILDTRAIYSGSDDPQANSQRRKPKLPLQPAVTAPFALVRFISHPDRPRNHDFLAEWVTRVRDWLAQGTKVYFFVHCPEEVYSPGTARWFQEMLEAQQVPVPPLPWNHHAQAPEPEPDQLSLF